MVTTFATAVDDLVVREHGAERFAPPHRRVGLVGETLLVELLEDPLRPLEVLGIAGAEVEGDEGFKIDLSQLFGAPTKDEDPIATAARERDEQLLLAGRDTVGIDDQLGKRQAERVSGPKDQLDELIDSLDEFDL